MNRYLKQFFLRGLVFGGFGPIVAGIIFWIVSLNVSDFSQSGGQILTAILSTYFLAFVQAGASVFNQIEHWPISKALLCHMSVVYAAYVSCYLVNKWIPTDLWVVLIFTAVFIVQYMLIWLIVFLCVRAASRRLNRSLEK